MMKFRNSACVIVAALMLLLVGCAPESQQPESNNDGTQNVTIEETTSGSGYSDSIFDDAQVGVEKPVAGRDDFAQETSSDIDGNASTEESGDSASTESTKNDNADLPAPGEMTYEEFMALSAEEQQAYQASFGEGTDGLDAFFQWYNAEKTKYEQENPPIDIGSGSIDLGKLAG